MHFASYAVSSDFSMMYQPAREPPGLLFLLRNGSFYFILEGGLRMPALSRILSNAFSKLMGK
jgi:hypothetical protein